MNNSLSPVYSFLLFFVSETLFISSFYSSVDGGPKVRHWMTPQDHLSTLSRPRSTEAITLNGTTIPNGRLLVNGSNGGVSGMNGINGINGVNGHIGNGNGHINGILTRGPGGLHEDSEFPPTPRTLSRKKNIIWMRPHVSILNCSRQSLWWWWWRWWSYLCIFKLKLWMRWMRISSQKERRACIECD